MQPDYLCGSKSLAYVGGFCCVWVDFSQEGSNCTPLLCMGDETLWSAPAVSGNVTLLSSLEEAQPMRTNVLRLDPVLVGLVQDGGAAARTSELWPAR